MSMDGCAEMDLSVVSNYNRGPLTYHMHGYREATCCPAQYAQSITLESHFPTVKLEKGHIVAGCSEL